jgi:hypothetical protein
MNQLAQFVYRLINGKETDLANLSISKGTAVTSLHSVLDRDPADLAAQLNTPMAQAEEWLILPRATSND